MPTTPVISLTDCLAAVLEQARAAQPALASKLAAAVAVIDHGLDQRVFPNHPDTGNYFVASQTSATVYSVNILDGTCTCLDAQHRGGPCKHVLAVRLLRAASYLRNTRQRAVDYNMAEAPTTVAEVAALVAAS